MIATTVETTIYDEAHGFIPADPELHGGEDEPETASPIISEGLRLFAEIDRQNPELQPF